MLRNCGTPFGAQHEPQDCSKAPCYSPAAKLGSDQSEANVTSGHISNRRLRVPPTVCTSNKLAGRAQLGRLEPHRGFPKPPRLSGLWGRGRPRSAHGRRPAGPERRLLGPRRPGAGWRRWTRFPTGGCWRRCPAPSCRCRCKGRPLLFIALFLCPKSSASHRAFSA